MDAKGKPAGAQMHHPAHRYYLATLILLGIMVLFGFITVFVPWVMKDIGVGTRAWAYPFKTCLEDTFSIVNQETCMDNDFIEPTGVPLTGGNAQCKGFILATIAFVFISVLLGVVVLILLVVTLLSLWSRPTCLAGVTQVLLIIVCVAAFLSWIMFICYAEKVCAPNSIFPVQGYSYGFIMYVFASAAALGAVVTGFMGLAKIRANAAIPAGGEELAAYPAYPAQPDAAGYYGVPPETPDQQQPVQPTPARSYNPSFNNATPSDAYAYASGYGRVPENAPSNTGYSRAVHYW